MFQYPLIPVPLSLAHVDGSLHKTHKAALMHKLEGKITGKKLKNIDACIVDAMLFIRTLSDLPITYWALAKLVLDKLLTQSRE